MVVRRLSFSASMRRWKPSVSSRVSSAAPLADSLSVVACVIRLFSLTDRSTGVVIRSAQKIAVLFHMRGEIERVLAREFLGEFGISSLQGLDDVEMINDGALGAIVLADRHLPDRAHVDEEIFGHLRDHLIAAHLDDRLVELDVRIGIFVKMALGRMSALELVKEMPEGRDLRIGGAQGDKPRGKAFKRRPHLDHLDDLALGFAHHEDAAARHGFDEAFLLQKRHRLTDGRAAYAQILRELPLVQTNLVRLVVDIDRGYRLLQRVVGLGAKARLRVDRLYI